MKNLVIVESPAKAKTIEKFLGKDYTVKSSYGHIRDLAKKEMSIDVEADYQPQYQISEDKRSLVSELQKAVKSAEKVWLASDEDREGEAIAWHLQETLKLNPETTQRIVFNEITKTAILHAIENPRHIDMNLVDAQQARRVLDRLVGYEISPILWSKIKPALSAGRVQSVAVRLIVERENEIKAFESKPYFRVTAQFRPVDSQKMLSAELSRHFEVEAEAEAFLQSLAGGSFKVSKIETKPAHRTPAPPFTTSTLQQEAARKLHLPQRPGTQHGEEGDFGTIRRRICEDTPLPNQDQRCPGGPRSHSPHRHDGPDHQRRERTAPPLRAHMETHRGQPDGRCRD